MLTGLRSDRGIIIGDNETKADVFLRQRGAYYGVHLAYLKPMGQLTGPHFLRLGLGAGLWQHKIRIIDDGNTVPQIRGDYKKGYDRLSNGLTLKQSLNYTYKSTRTNAHFFIEIEGMEGFIKNRRDWDILEQKKLDNSRMDITYGLRVGWILIIQGDRDTKEDIYY